MVIQVESFSYVVALDVASGKNLVIVFDELFKGTNVKDAYDATVAVTRAWDEDDPGDAYPGYFRKNRASIPLKKR